LSIQQANTSAQLTGLVGEGAQHITLTLRKRSLLSRHTLIVSSPRRKEVYICTLKVCSSKFSAGKKKKGTKLYTISALYLKVSGLGVRESSRIYAQVAEVSPALVTVAAGGDGRQAGMSWWQASEAVIGPIGGLSWQAGRSGWWVRWAWVRWIRWARARQA